MLRESGQPRDLWPHRMPLPLAVYVHGRLRLVFLLVVSCSCGAAGKAAEAGLHLCLMSTGALRDSRQEVLRLGQLTDSLPTLLAGKHTPGLRFNV